jgi:hypothetical protein
MSTYVNPRTNFLNRKIVFLANETPDEVVQGAAVAILTENTWHIFGCKNAHSLDRDQFPLPEGMECPVVDISNIPAECDLFVKNLMDSFKDRKINHVQLVAGLKALGALELEKWT